MLKIGLLDITKNFSLLQKTLCNPFKKRKKIWYIFKYIKIYSFYLLFGLLFGILKHNLKLNFSFGKLQLILEKKGQESRVYIQFKFYVLTKLCHCTGMLVLYIQGVP